MRAPSAGKAPKAVLAIVFAVTALLTAAQAGAEAPFFYDDLFNATFYDPEFKAQNRPRGYLAGLIQGWSRPEVGAHARQSLARQDWTDQYRLIWNAPLPKSPIGLLIELKGAGARDVVPDDYWARGEIYGGLETAPIWLYGGFRAPQEGAITIYGGLESMSYRIEDLFKNAKETLPIAFKGYAEIRYNEDDNDNPVLRLMLLSHNIVGEWLGPFTIGVPIESLFSEGQSPQWILSPHVDIKLTDGFFRLDLNTGYAVDLASGGEQRAMIGLRGAFGATGGLR
jgi:hypothetical protein